MIVIVDNGQEYSDHKLYFIESGDIDPNDVIRVLHLDWRRGDAFEVARTEHLDWRKDRTMSLAEAFESPDEDLVTAAKLRELGDKALELVASRSHDLELDQLILEEWERRAAKDGER